MVENVTETIANAMSSGTQTLDVHWIRMTLQMRQKGKEDGE